MTLGGGYDDGHLADRVTEVHVKDVVGQGQSQDSSRTGGWALGPCVT